LNPVRASNPITKSDRWPTDVTLHDVEQNLELVMALTGRAAPQPVRLHFPLDLNAPQGASSEPYFIVHPGSSTERGMTEKRLPPEVFAELIVRIFQKYGVRAVLVGGPEEADLQRQINNLVVQIETREFLPSEKKQQGALALLNINTQNLAELGSVVSNSKFYLGNDSGIMHIAVALEIPCAAFFGPTDERRTGPYGWQLTPDKKAKHRVIRMPGLACSPCRTNQNIGSNPPCITADIRCLRGFSAEAAWQQIQPFVDSLF